MEAKGKVIHMLNLRQNMQQYPSTHLIRCEHVGAIRVQGVQDTVGRHQDGSGEPGKIRLLAVPGDDAQQQQQLV